MFDLNTELPLGFGMALAQSAAAMHQFERLNVQGARYYLCRGGSCARPADSIAEPEGLGEL